MMFVVGCVCLVPITLSLALQSIDLRLELYLA